MATNFEIHPLAASIGAEITGLDLRQALDDETAAELRKAWLQHLVLLFRDQDISDEDEVRFATYFGSPFRRDHVEGPARPKTPPNTAIMLIGNIRENGEQIGSLPDGELQFHSDSAFQEEPLMATLLYGVHIPSTGGNTLFANMYAAYDSLDPAIKDKLGRHRALNVFDFRVQVKTAPLAREKAVYADHPVIRTHPETGRKAIYVNRLMTEEIFDMAPDESEAVLENLFQLAEQPEYIYEHTWRPGDLLIWDNRCVQHARTDFPASETRLLKRVGISGDKPH